MAFDNSSTYYYKQLLQVDYTVSARKVIIGSLRAS